jgi:signal transduction histidine kinase
VAFVLCVVLLPTTIQVLSSDFGLSGGLASVLAVAQTAPLLLAVLHPLEAWCIVFAANIAGALALLTVDLDGHAWPYPPMEVIGYVALCLALGLREPRRTLLSVWLATTAASIGLRFAAPADATDTSVLVIVLSGVALVIGGVLRELYEARRRLAEQETISEAERARRTLLEERARIARELHDIVAHHMSVITVQADTAAYRLDGVSPEVQEEFTSIAATARESLGEMRRLLGVLRSEEAYGELAPQPGLADIGQLVEATVRAGVPVDLTFHDADVPETVGLSAYRVVQEALANIVRHAPGAPTQVSVSEDGEQLTVLVVNGPSPEPPVSPLEEGETGHGLVGMRERLRLVGGTLEVGPLPDGGFRVAAQLPLTEGDVT